ncbi:MFS transporter [Streptacidiphilus jiangxiensis]|uniref:Predicted arabinose efflux permease, MFS family n=1 Tax=Streptacidiphilus jiangxiensis TaxID=235985 RepID=A0A1H7QT70_STRJI|nr:MFS transporter [Streptacidiphilus jiangxiensis]SEL51210.1 Predicted arabinose efflux permease, MFS family [Streptacidiphilus jiangxiensis]
MTINSPGSPPAAEQGPNRLAPTRFVLAFGVVSMLADFVYEGARSVTGPYLATFGASAALVGFVTGFGEAVALVLRLLTGPLADRTRGHWAQSITGYAITIVAVPLLAVTQALWPAAALVVAERFGKAVRTPARDTMLAQASTEGGRGRAFALHEALDQSGALLGPLLVAAMIAVSGYRLGFAVLAVPGALALLTLAWLRRAVPRPEAYEKPHPAARADQQSSARPTSAALPGRFWLYAAFTATSMAGFATFGVLGYHLQTRHVVPVAVIPVVYAAAMGAAALAALASGHLYDRVGLRGLVVALPLSAAVPLLSFSTRPALVWVGAVVWGAAMGIHESTLRAAVADLVPAHRRGTGYGVFTAVYGLAWLAGSTLIGALYSHSITAVVVFTAITQAVALVLFVPLARQGVRPPTDG